MVLGFCLGYDVCLLSVTRHHRAGAAPPCCQSHASIEMGWYPPKLQAPFSPSFFCNFCLALPLPPWFLTWVSPGLAPLCLQTAHSLELEALRLSLNNMHTAQLELTQANLQKEKETALTELREMLNGRRAQELALLQSRQQCELELLREQHAREKEEMVLRSGQEAGRIFAVTNT